MTINIQNLLEELVTYSVPPTRNRSCKANDTLNAMGLEFDELKASSDPKKQTKMIKLLIGGIILTLRQEYYKYSVLTDLYKFELYPKQLFDKVFTNVEGNTPLIEAMYSMGEQALLNLP